MGEYDLAQVQIRMIGVAEKLMADLKLIKPDITQEQWLEQKLKWFDLAYKAIEKTVKG